MLSPSNKIEVMAQESSDREICLLTITHPDFDQTLYLSTDPTEYLYDEEETNTPIYGTVSRGHQFIFLPIQPTLPGSDSETPPVARFSISNVSRLIAPYLLMVNDKYPKVTLEIVMASDKDTVIQVYPEFDMMTATIDANTAEVQIGMNIASNEPCPWLRFIPSYFPNLFD